MDLLSEIRDAWGWAGIDPVEIVDKNSFGNLIIKDRNGKYWRLCPEEVYCEVIAKSCDEMNGLSNDPDYLGDWGMAELVEAAEKSVGPLCEDRVYRLTIPSVLGGAYDASNVKAVSIVELIRFSGDLGKQIRDLPDGAQVKLKFID